ncbi:MAG: sigma 54-interacting transcriptional regulator [Candidatus Latescibacteria bacterium]|nr:sigma 54-interacting transcriptional regulator [Candidatus Latescibacterota bacterium]
MMNSQFKPKAPGERGVWEQFTLEDGLPDLKLECLFADCRGMLWIGTHDRGVARFDGERFETFTTREGLAGDGVYSILEDQEGALWFGTMGGLSRYDGKQFETVQLPSGERCGFRRGSCMDQEGRLWFGVKGRPGDPVRVCRWDGRGLEQIALAESVDLRLRGIDQIIAGPGREVWFGGAGLYRYDGAQFHTLVEPPTTPADLIFYMILRTNGELWHIQCKGDLTVWKEDQARGMGREFAGHRLNGLLEDGEGRVWATSWQKALLRGDGAEFAVVQKTGNPLQGNPCLDQQGRLWCRTYGWGLYCYDTTRFEVFKKEQGLPAAEVNCLAEDGRGRLWVGTSAGITGYDGQGFQALEQAEALQGKSICALQADEAQRLWITTWTSLYVHEKGILRLSEVPEISCSGLTNLAVDRGKVWFGYQYQYKGFSFGCLEEGQVRYFPFDDAYPFQVGGLLVDRKGRLWIGSRYADTWEGVCRYDGERFTPFTQADGLAGGGVYALYEDREGGIWIGTAQGASRYDGQRFTTFTQTEGLPFAIVRAIAQTQDGKLWFGTEGGGVGCYDGQVLQIIQLSGNPDLNRINAVCQNRQDQIWFGTEGGLVRYTPQQVPPTISLTQVVADQTYEGSEAIEIPTTAGRISFCFQGKSTVDRASRLVYRYRLKGHETCWHQTRKKQVDYPQLKPGEYCFQVQAVDTDLNYSAMATAQVKVIEDLRIEGLTEVLRVGSTGQQLIGQSRAWRQVQADLAQVALTDLTVLILGETGTGKGLAAGSIHQQSPRRSGPFIQVNCGAIPTELVESELFGHERGAFTGAVSRKLGKFELAEGGTLFLDEIGDLPLGAQAALLQFLQEKTFQRVGGREILTGDVRIIAATNRDLQATMREGEFRKDLFYRLSAFVVELPPLRQRREDIPLLVDYFAGEFARHLDRPAPAIDPEVVEYLQAYSWSGNVRELEHLVQRAVLLCKEGVIHREDVAVPSPVSRAEVATTDGMLETMLQSGNGNPEGDLLERAEEVVLRLALTKAQGNKSKAATLLHTDRKKVERRARKYRLGE